MIEKLAIAVFIIMIVSLSVAGCTSSTSTNNTNFSLQPDTAYQTAEGNALIQSSHGFKLIFPKSWTYSTNPDEKIALYLDINSNSLNGLNVAVQPLNKTTGTTLQAYSNYATKDLPHYYADYKMWSYGSTTLGGEPANKIVYQATIPQKISENNYQNAAMKVTQCYTIHNGKGYVVTYKAVPSDYDTYLKQAQETVNSFTFTG